MRKNNLRAFVFTGKTFRMKFFVYQEERVLKKVYYEIPPIKERGTTKEHKKSIREFKDKIDGNIHKLKKVLEKMSDFELELYRYNFDYIKAKQYTFTELLVMSRQEQITNFILRNG